MVNKNLLISLSGLAIVIGLLFVFKPNNLKTPDSTPALSKSTQVFNLNIIDKKVVSGNEKITVTEGDNVDLRITSDIDGEFHLHGYDKSVDLMAGKTVDLIFSANITGSFPYELETTKTDLGSVEVAPK